MSKSEPMSKFRFKKVMRLDHNERLFRIGCFLWQRGKVGDGQGYSAKLSLALSPRLFRWRSSRTITDREMTLFGVRVHYVRAYGGHIV